MKKIVTAFVLAAVAPALAAHAAQAAGRPEGSSRGRGDPTGGCRVKVLPFARSGLNYHNGPVLVSAKAVFIFWGPTSRTPRRRTTPTPRL